MQHRAETRTCIYLHVAAKFPLSLSSGSRCHTKIQRSGVSTSCGTPACAVAGTVVVGLLHGATAGPGAVPSMLPTCAAWAEPTTGWTCCLPKSRRQLTSCVACSTWRWVAARSLAPGSHKKVHVHESSSDREGHELRILKPSARDTCRRQALARDCGLSCMGQQSACGSYLVIILFIV